MGGKSKIVKKIYQNSKLLLVICELINKLVYLFFIDITWLILNLKYFNISNWFNVI